MKLATRAFAVIQCLAFAPWLLAQQPTTPAGFLEAALKNMGAAQVQPATLSGNLELIAGSTDESGTFTAQCAVNGASQLQLQVPSNSHTENRAFSNGASTGVWIDAQGNTHAIAGHNLMTPASWFCPSVVLAGFVQNQQSLNIQLVGQTTKNGVPAVHISVTATVPDSSPSSLLTAHLAQTDVYLNAATLLPIAFDFNTHPDNDATTDIPVEIQFSSFLDTAGMAVPHTIEKFVNSTLAESFQVTSVSVAVAPSQAQN